MSIHRMTAALLPLAAILSWLAVPAAQADPQVIVAMGFAGGQSSDIVVVPLTLHAIGAPPSVAGLDVVVTWDAPLAQLDEVRLTPATQEWLMAANILSGRVDVSMAALSTATATPAGLPMLEFVFTLGDVVGQTPLALSETRLFDLGQQAVDHLTADGSLDVGIVAGADVSLGYLKRTFADSMQP